MKGCDVNQIVKCTTRCSKRRFQVIKRQLHLSGKIWLWRAIVAAPYLAGNKQQITRTNRGRITVLFIESVSAGRENRFVDWPLYFHTLFIT